MTNNVKKTIQNIINGVTRKIVRRGYIFVRTCSACPEQYDIYKVLKPNKQIGYLRLRFGTIQLTTPDVGGKLLINEKISDDEFKGCFASVRERNAFFDKSIELLNQEV